MGTSLQTQAWRDEGQVADDPGLLDAMMTALESADAVYHTTNYWKRYERRLLPYLRSTGLRDFRRARGGKGPKVLSSFGARDLVAEDMPGARHRDRYIRIERVAADIPGLHALAHHFAKRRIRDTNKAQAWQRLRYEFARQIGREAGAEPIEELSVSRVGNPEDAFEVDGRWYTELMLYYYIRYAYVARFVRFSEINCCVELGSGSGKQAEILHKLHPHLTLCLFDIPPQLYVCHQYLSAVFVDAVVPFRETQKMRDLSNLEPGKIYIFGNWMFPITRQASIDLFWNAASFAEMEPDVVANYLSLVDGSAANVYLMQLMVGQKLSKGAGKRGVLKKTTLDHYRNGMPSFDLIDMSPTQMPDTRTSEYHDSFWRRKQHDGTGLLER